jgi:hypothetical protein
MLFALTIAWLIFAVAFFRALYVEARQTSWELLEGLIGANILGHVVAYPLSRTITDPGCYFGTVGFETEIVSVAFIATVVCACMAGGAIWVFRRMKMLGESRRSVRILYMVLGLLLFPSMVLFPFNLMVGWMIWWPLAALNTNAKLAVAAAAARARHAEAATGQAQLRYTVRWSSNSGKSMAEERTINS